MFFDEDDLDVEDPRLMQVSACGTCGLHDGCESPKMPVTGDGQRGILVIAEAPGQTEDERGVQLIGKAGQRLRETLCDLNCDLDTDCWKTNAVICRPPNNKLDNKCIDFCRPNVYAAIEEFRPKVIILLGASSVRSVIGREWTGDIGAFGRWVGWKIPMQSLNAWVCPTYHPSYLLRKKNPLLDLWFKKHLSEALSLLGRPWVTVPSFQDEVTIEESPSDAADIIRDMSDRFQGEPVAFDYETDRLKPDNPNSQIRTCAICWAGKYTLAYPWHGDAVKATSEVLQSKVPKYGTNIKFEQRWTKAILGHGVRNWKWDTMQAAHILDCRPGITSVKFQAFVRLGQALWSGRVDDFLKASSGNAKNKIAKAELSDLLLYNGMDSLIEYKVAVHQMAEMEDMVQ